MAPAVVEPSLKYHPVVLDVLTWPIIWVGDRVWWVV